MANLARSWSAVWDRSVHLPTWLRVVLAALSLVVVGVLVLAVPVLLLRGCGEVIGDMLGD